jgi:hypothetical protein
MSKTVTILMAVRDQLNEEIKKLDLGHRTKFSAPGEYESVRYQTHPPIQVLNYEEMRNHHRSLNPHSFVIEYAKDNPAQRVEAGYSINIIAEGLYALRHRVDAYIKAEL